MVAAKRVRAGTTRLNRELVLDQLKRRPSK
jgi:hypothetical protein